MIEEKEQSYAGQGVRGPLWTVAGTAIGGLALGVLGALAGGVNGGMGGGPTKDMQITELKAQNFTLKEVAPLQSQLAFQGATIGYLQRTLDAVTRPMVPMPNVAGPAFPPPPYPFPVPPAGGTATPTGADSNA